MPKTTDQILHFCTGRIDMIQKLVDTATERKQFCRAEKFTKKQEAYRDIIYFINQQ